MSQDAITGSWTATCDISIGAVDRHQVFSGRMFFQFLPESAGSATTVFDFLYQVDPSDLTRSESVPSVYDVTATLQGHRVAVHAEVAFDSLNPGPGDRIFCSSTIAEGTLGTQPPTLFEASMSAFFLN